MYERAERLVGLSEHSNNSLRSSARPFFKDDTCIREFLWSPTSLPSISFRLWRTLKSFEVCDWTFIHRSKALSSTLQTASPLLYFSRFFSFLVFWQLVPKTVNQRASLSFWRVFVADVADVDDTGGAEVDVFAGVGVTEMAWGDECSFWVSSPSNLVVACSSLVECLVALMF